jgi:hypothetical protein
MARPVGNQAGNQASAATPRSARWLAAAIGGVLGVVVGFLLHPFVLPASAPAPVPPNLAGIERSLADLAHKLDELRAAPAAPKPEPAAAPTARSEDTVAVEARLRATIDRLEQLVRDVANSGSPAAAERLRAARARQPAANFTAVAELHRRFMDATDEQIDALKREWLLRDMADVLDHLGSPTSLGNQLGDGALAWIYTLPNGDDFTIWFRGGLVTHVGN